MTTAIKLLPIPLSSSQQTIFSSILSHNKNVLIQGPIASGKTLLALHIALSYATTASISQLFFLTSSPSSHIKVLQWLKKYTDPVIRDRIHVHTPQTLVHTYSQTQILSHRSDTQAPHTTIPSYSTVIIDDLHYLTQSQYQLIISFLLNLPQSPRLLLLGDPFHLLTATNSAEPPAGDYLLEANFYFLQLRVGNRWLCVQSGLSNYLLQDSFSLSPEVSQWMHRCLRPDCLLKRGRAAWERNQARIGTFWAARTKDLGTGEASVQEIDVNQRDLSELAKDGVVETIAMITELYERDQVSIIPIGSTKKVAEIVKRMEQLGVIGVENLRGAEKDVVVLVGLDAFYDEEMNEEEIVHGLNQCYIAAMHARKLLVTVKLGPVVVPSLPATGKAVPKVFEYNDLTDEQQLVVDSIAKHGRNVVVNAVAGSGKTRTALTSAVEWLRRYNNQGAVLLVAYNKRLQEDMQAQRDGSVPVGLRYLIEVRTIHGLGHTYFGGTGLTTDKELAMWTQRRASPIKPLPSFKLIIIDEAQDLTPMLFEFLHYFISLFDEKPQLLVLGDPFQLLYRFNGAKEEYMIEADKMFGDVVKDAPFDHLKLSICFRITHEMAAWINEHLNPNNLSRAQEPWPGWFDSVKTQIAMWWGNGIRANPHRPPAPHSVEYFKRDLFQDHMLQATLEKIVEVFSEYDTDSSALLSPSIVAHDYSPVRRITNSLTTINGNNQSWYHDCNLQMTDSDSPDVRQNKRIASTIHRFKGRERDAIVLVGMDSFAEQREKCDPRNVFNMFYVGATRAREKLLIIEWSSPAYATHRSRKEQLKEGNYLPNMCPVTKALEHCPYDSVLCQESEDCLTTRTELQIAAAPLSRYDYIVKGSHHGVQRDTLENVSSVIGVALEVRLQLLLDHGYLRIPVLTREATKGLPLSLIDFITTLSQETKNRNEYSWWEILKIATAMLTITDRFYNRWRQVQDFASWPVVMEPLKLDALVGNLVNLIYEPFCRDTKFKPNMDEVPFQSKLEALQELRKQGRLQLQREVRFDMVHNQAFVKQYGMGMEGGMDIILFPPGSVESMNSKDPEAIHSGNTLCYKPIIKQTEEDVEKTIIVEVKATTHVKDDHRLQVACYGAMWREHQITKANCSNFNSEYSQLTDVSSWQSQSQPDEENVEEKEMLQRAMYSNSLNSSMPMPVMYVAYPNLGQLRQVSIHINSFEFLHRIGCRKTRQQFDKKMLYGEHFGKSQDDTSSNMVIEVAE